jgi:hypothetical protein
MSLEDQRKFDSWCNASGVLGFILFLGMLAVALATIPASPIPSSVAAGVENPASAQGGVIVLPTR